MLIIKNLGITLGQFSLKNINLSLNTGEYFVLLGPSGSGKTLLLETIAGRYIPDCGEISFNGESLLALPPEKRGIGFVYQHYELFPHMTVEENITFGPRIKKQSKDVISDNLNKLTALLSIGHLLKRYPKNLSGGEMQRAALARALIMSPDILLFDEPMSALDMPTKLVLQEEIKKIHESYKVIVLHVTHDIEEAFFLADRIGVMENGELIQTGYASHIASFLSCDFIKNFLDTQRRRKVSNGVLQPN